ncbi:MAG: hypothetical protein P1U32_02335 [Legionellaceae bacterium]|nr:hypothetical protein [Legionellaceae bacterium]
MLYDAGPHAFYYQRRYAGNTSEVDKKTDAAYQLWLKCREEHKHSPATVVADAKYVENTVCKTAYTKNTPTPPFCSELEILLRYAFLAKIPPVDKAEPKASNMTPSGP